MNGGTQAPKLERKTVEKNRRELFNRLLSKLSSVIGKEQTPDCSKDGFKKQEILEEATSYIKKLRGNIETLNQERNRLMQMNCMLGIHSNNESDHGKMDVQVRALDACLEVVLISGLNKNFKLYEVIGILEEEGAEVIHASFSKVEDKIVHIIHSQAISSRIGLEEKRIKERLEELV
ncbi:hypothetical protein J5N97_019508 [Dioscorea zingiberensis]|uniref:BHLH domain-containing protein n=1 Tax=Dioscorea zingiberensis TaxID=325984 RepID=A0A9D5CEQ9_9LILI|nr:hypothetical protein J5N97_019508 [Dioscorea zingiberensis]